MESLPVDVRESLHLPLKSSTEIQQLLNSLDRLGVTSFESVYWQDDMGSDHDVLWPHFKVKGVRFSATHLDHVRRAQCRLARLLEEASEESFPDTNGEYENVMVRFAVTVAAPDRQIRAYVRVIESFDTCNDGLPFQLL